MADRSRGRQRPMRRSQSEALGQLAYYAYWQRWPAVPLAWGCLKRQERRAWEAAGRAIVSALSDDTTQWEALKCLACPWQGVTR